jgi:outer membrane protein TolC
MKESSVLPQRIISLLAILGLALALTAIQSPVAAAQEAASTDQAAAEQSPADDGIESLPSSQIEKAEKDGTALYLSLKEVTRLALQNNIDIAIEETNEQAAIQNLKSAQGSYDPSLSFSFGLNSRKSANTRLDTASADTTFTTSRGVNWDATFSMPVKTGGNIQANWRTSRSSTDEAFSFFNPQYSTSATVSFTQPLWKNLSIDQNRSQLKIRKLDLETSDISFKQTVTARISQIKQAYWDLVSAIRDYDIQRNSVRLAMINLRDNRKRVEVGTQAPITIIESEYQVAQRKQNLTSAEQRIEQQMNTMRQYISTDRNNEIWSKIIIPTDTPDFEEYRIELDSAVETALKNSPELKQSDLELQTSEINLAVARNNRKWGVDVTAQFGSSGSSGTPGPTANPDFIAPEYIGGVGTAYNNLFTQGLINWQIQVSVDLPIRNRSADASYANQLISQKRTILNRQRTEQQLVVEIRNAYQALKTSHQQVETAQLGKRLAQEQLEGEQKRYDAGLSENYRVLEQQDALAQAENTELTRLISYKKSIIALQEAMNTLLEASDFEISRSASEHIPDLY